MVKLEPQRPGGGFRHLFHTTVGGGAEHHQRVGHPGAAGGGGFTFGVGHHVAASGGDHDRHTNLGAQHGGGYVPLGDVAQEPGPQRQVLEGAPVSPSGELVHGAGFDELPVVVGQGQLGPCFVVVQIDGLQTHGCLRIV